MYFFQKHFSLATCEGSKVFKKNPLTEHKLTHKLDHKLNPNPSTARYSFPLGGSRKGALNSHRIMKTRKYILPLLALMISFISAKSYAQDIVVMKDGTILDVYNLKESSTYYYFSSDSSSNAIVKKVKKADVFSVKKKDGTIIPATSDTVTTKSLDSAVHKPVTAQLSSEITKKRRQKIFSARTPDGHELNYAILSDDDHTLKVIKGTYHESKYIIPDYVQVNDIKYTVTEIDDGAFKMEYTVVSVDFPSTLKKIGDEAFEYSGLKKAILPEGLESIGDHAFVGCPLSQISIPSSIKYDVGEKAFAYSENGLFTGEILQISENLLKDIYTRWGISQESFEEYIASKTSKKANSSKGSTIVSKPSKKATTPSSNIKDLTEAAEQGDASNPSSSSSNSNKVVYEYDRLYDASMDAHIYSMKYPQSVSALSGSVSFQVEVIGNKDGVIIIMLSLFDIRKKGNTIASWGNKAITYPENKIEDCSLSISLSNGESIQLRHCDIYDYRIDELKGSSIIGSISILLGLPNTTSTGKTFSNDKERYNYLLEQCCKYDIKGITFDGQTLEMDDAHTAPTINDMITTIRKKNTMFNYK